MTVKANFPMDYKMGAISDNCGLSVLYVIKFPSASLTAKL